MSETSQNATQPTSEQGLTPGRDTGISSQDQAPQTWKSLAEAAADLAQKDAAAAGEPLCQIAQLEIDLAKAREDASTVVADLEQKLSDAQAEIVTLNTRLSDAQRPVTDYDAKLKAQLDISNTLIKELDEERRLHVSAASALTQQKKDYTWLDGLFDQQAAKLETAYADLADLKGEVEMLKTAAAKAQRPKIETLIKREPGMQELADLINAGWRVVFETVYVIPYIGVDPESYHFVRLEREAQTAAYTPQPETKAAAAAPEAIPDASPAAEDDYAIKGVSWEDAPSQAPVLVPMEVDATVSPLAAYRLSQSAQTEQTGTLIMPKRERPHNMQRRQFGTLGPKYAEDAIDHEVLEDGSLRLGGWFRIDPAKMPIAATLIQHGAAALNEAMDGKVKAAAVAAMQKHRPSTPPPPTLGIGS